MLRYRSEKKSDSEYWPFKKLLPILVSTTFFQLVAEQLTDLRISILSITISLTSQELPYSIVHGANSRLASPDSHQPLVPLTPAGGAHSVSLGGVCPMPNSVSLVLGCMLTNPFCRFGSGSKHVSRISGAGSCSRKPRKMSLH